MVMLFRVEMLGQPHFKSPHIRQLDQRIFLAVNFIDQYMAFSRRGDCVGKLRFYMIVCSVIDEQPVLARQPTAISQGCVSPKTGFTQGCPTRLSYKAVEQGSRARLSFNTLLTSPSVSNQDGRNILGP
jgi:hypothetical protein